MKRATALDVAQLAGVPHSIAILALHKVPGIRINDAVRRRILDAVREFRYTIPSAADIQPMVPAKKRTIALIERRPAECCYRDATFIRMLLGMHRAARAFGFEIRSFAIPEEGQNVRWHVFLRRFKPGGIIFSTPQKDDADALDFLAEKVPLVVRGFLPNCKYPSARIDKYAAARAATDHLLRLGHVQVGALLHADATRPDVEERMRGYRDSILESDGVFDPEKVAHACCLSGSGELCMRALLDAQADLTAVFASSDVVALDAMQAVQSQGLRVPEDMALVGLGDIPAAARAEPALTTMRKPAVAVGWLAADLVIRRMSGREAVERAIALLPEMIVRESCGALCEDNGDLAVKVDMLH